MTCQASIEYLRNIKKLHVYTTLDTLPDDVIADIKTSFQVGSVSKSAVDGITVFSFQNSIQKVPLPEVSFSTFEAKDLKGSTHISCRCGQIISQDSSLVYKDLPSKYWMDLIDCWSCHKSEFAPITNKIDICANGSQLILPGRGTVHVGLEGLLCNLEDVSIGFNGACYACGEQVGEAMESHIMLFWHMLNISRSNGDVNTAASLLKLLISRLHENMQSFASQSFNIVHNEDLVSVTVMNWDLLTLNSTILKPAVKMVVHTEPLTNFELVKVDKITMMNFLHAIETSWPALTTDNGRIVTLRY